ncbi:flavin-containing monooxygenase 3 isoform X3 [Musca domestica]|uniref:Flavin-containing monooxygenase n=1 Tax=Musca domestica TaxID=7370 RepID=A0A9J7DI30_MUSDO|nr:flavin-containing monooxygenase 3 isoform X3 [Musca domestica]
MTTMTNGTGISVCVIGAGTAGLTALKNSLEHQLNVVCYEQGKVLGGTWVYEDLSPNIRDDDEIHSSMYQGLRTNLPKEVMGYLDFPYPQSMQESFVGSQVVLDFLNLYADHYNLKRHIKFQHEVVRVKPRCNNQWEVHVLDHCTDKCFVTVFDRIFICNGHYTKPQYPRIDGMELFQGCKMHSHIYREPQKFKGENVLIIGAGPSGMDLANHISKTANRIFLSHHLKEAPDTDFMGTVTQKPDVKRFTRTGAIFKDGTEEEFSCVIFCTGYQYSFPFLSVDCGIYVTNNHVQPLYKHCINIQHPTMAIIGIPYLVLPTQCFDLQVRFALKYFVNEKELPSTEEMMEELRRDMKERKERGLSERDAHQMGEKQFDYYKELAAVAGHNVKPVIAKIMKDCSKKYIYELETYREYQFTIVDDEYFVKVPSK